ncbi:MAG: hypothetical protein AOY29_06885 [Alcanivorax borkumensis]|nr:MAG: hypothetical protein AOY29_06885 [Alcanivorax borkumensis]
MTRGIIPSHQLEENFFHPLCFPVTIVAGGARHRVHYTTAQYSYWQVGKMQHITTAATVLCFNFTKKQELRFVDAE